MPLREVTHGQYVHLMLARDPKDKIVVQNTPDGWEVHAGDEIMPAGMRQSFRDRARHVYAAKLRERGGQVRYFVCDSIPLESDEEREARITAATETATAEVIAWAKRMTTEERTRPASELSQRLNAVFVRRLNRLDRSGVRITTKEGRRAAAPETKD